MANHLQQKLSGLTNQQKLTYTYGFAFLLFLLPVAAAIYILCLRWYCVFIIFLPVIMLVICLLYTGGAVSSVKKKLAAIKFNSFCPLLFYYDPGPDRYGFKGCADVKKIIQPGDILLRRHKSYLDGLVLGQASFFTHAGIYYGDYYVYKSQVIHAVGEGVGFISIDDFSRCDDILVLRFDDKKDISESEIDPYDISFFKFMNYETETDLSPEDLTNALPQTEAFREKKTHSKEKSAAPLRRKIKKNGSVYDGEIIYIKDVRVLFEREMQDESVDMQNAGKRELEVYDEIANALRLGQKYQVDMQRCIDIIKNMAITEYGKPYDYDFDFTDFTALSCVEFVWFCYKCLYPLYAVQRSDYRYFSWIKTHVIVPDDFIRSKFFKIIYTSICTDDKKIKISGDNNAFKDDIKEKILEYTQSNKVNIWRFYLNIIVWEVALLLVIRLILYLYCKHLAGY